MNATDTTKGETPGAAYRTKRKQWHVASVGEKMREQCHQDNVRAAEASTGEKITVTGMQIIKVCSATEHEYRK